jgi:hypothetical protein
MSTTLPAGSAPAAPLTVETTVRLWWANLTQQVFHHSCRQLWSLVLENRIDLVTASEIVRQFRSDEEQALILDDVLAIAPELRIRFVRTVAEMSAERRASAIVDAMADATAAPATNAEATPKLH